MPLLCVKSGALLSKTVSALEGPKHPNGNTACRPQDGSVLNCSVGTHCAVVQASHLDPRASSRVWRSDA